MLCMVHKITAFHGTISIYSIHQDRGMQSRLQMRHNIIAYLMEVYPEFFICILSKIKLMHI